MLFFMSDETRLKLRTRHKVNDSEIIECFKNRVYKVLIDDREEHHTYPPTKWFIAQTNKGRELKIVFVQIAPNKIVIKTAYETNERLKQVYYSQARG